MASSCARYWIQSAVSSRIRGLGTLYETLQRNKNSDDYICRFLGTRPVKLIRMQVQGHPSILALSSRSWLNYTYQGLLHFSPLISEPWNHACGLAAEQCPEGLIGITGNLLKYVDHHPTELLNKLINCTGFSMFLVSEQSSCRRPCHYRTRLENSSLTLLITTST